RHTRTAPGHEARRRLGPSKTRAPSHPPGAAARPEEGSPAPRQDGRGMGSMSAIERSPAPTPEARESDPDRTSSPLKVMLVASSGGHLIQLYRLRPWWDRHRRTWVTFRKSDSLSMLSGEEVVWAYHPTTRNVPNALRNLLLAWRSVRRTRPDVI